MNTPVDLTKIFTDALTTAPGILAISGGLMFLLMLLACLIIVVQSLRAKSDHAILDATRFFIKICAGVAVIQIAVALVEYHKAALVSIDTTPVESPVDLPGFHSTNVKCTVTKDCPAHVRIEDNDIITLWVAPLTDEIKRLHEEKDTASAVEQALERKNTKTEEATSHKDIGIGPEPQVVAGIKKAEINAKDMGIRPHP